MLYNRYYRPQTTTNERKDLLQAFKQVFKQVQHEQHYQQDNKFARISHSRKC
jgi:hypothetical protein